MKKTLLVLIAAAAIAGCNEQQSGTSAAQAQPLRTAAKPAKPASPNLLTGKVAETMSAAGYTYVRVGDQWAAVRQTNLKEGDTVTIAAEMVAENFESKTLGRKFEKIIFGSLVNGTPTNGAPAPVAQPLMSAQPQTRVSVAHVEKAAGGKTVAEVWAGKSALKDKPVVIRGTVVKFLPEIMGKNWLHLRDGSGSREKGDDDITVTTKETVKVGDVVTVNGTLRVDKDFGAGYLYGVIVEDAKVLPR